MEQVEFHSDKRIVQRHEHFDELCAAASIGQASPEELLELEQHGSECEQCHEAYEQYLRLAGQQFALAHRDQELTPQEANECLNSDLLTQRFFERAQEEGIRFSDAVARKTRDVVPSRFSFYRAPLWWQQPRIAFAACLLITVSTLGGYHLYRHHWASANFTSVANPHTPEPVVADHSQQQVADLSRKNQRLAQQVEELSASVQQLNGRIRLRDANLESASAERMALAADRDRLQAQLEDAQRVLVESQAAVASSQREIAALQGRTKDLESNLVADHARLVDTTQELMEKTASLDKEHQLLALSRDVSDLMGARNLHIVDVVDTDARGKTQPAFGRIFFTEGKSLLFYAFDLNEAKLERAKLEYRVWAKQETGNKKVRNLGIFYRDDKTQRRWVFKCDDPRILKEIDSVFVTLEAPNSNPSYPKGANLMYAYLRGQPNHP